MSDATDHALEQAERIVQYAKYSDRFMVVEGDSTAERRAFVKLIGQKLPRQVRPVLLRADPGNGSAALIDQLGTLLQLSAGIETIDQLITAATAALEGQERLLIMVENADHWLSAQASDALFDLINQAHSQAPERVLFLLVGSRGLCATAQATQALAAVAPDLHCVQLLGKTQAQSPAHGAAATTSAGAVGTEPAPATTQAPAPATNQAQANASPTEHAARDPQPTRSTSPPRQSSWTSPTLLIAAVVSIAVVAIATFALLGGMQDPTPEPTAVALDSDGREAATGVDDSSDDAFSEDGPASRAAEGTAAAENQTREASAVDRGPNLEGIDHGQPPYVPLSKKASAPAQAPAADVEVKTANDGDSARSTPSGAATKTQTETRAETQAETRADPLAEASRGAAAATPPTDVDNDWYRDQPRARAAIQIAAFGKLEHASQMIDRFASEDRPRDAWRIYTQRIDGKVLYTVTLGDFPSAERARHAIDALPAEL
ncbi:MAG TPA: hypothetical protein ENO19_09240, partial [Halothiobacillaceae bacterium]|nr:hypothetical protein [Halothiobacillaceae bacterium]